MKDYFKARSNKIMCLSKFCTLLILLTLIFKECLQGDSRFLGENMRTLLDPRSMYMCVFIHLTYVKICRDLPLYISNVSLQIMCNSSVTPIELDTLLHQKLPIGSYSAPCNVTKSH